MKTKRFKLIVHRDSVAMGDDVFAPHEKKLSIDEDATVESVINNILSSNYLPKIIGGKATWIVVGKNPLAVIAQQWNKPRYLVKSTDSINEITELENGNHIEIKYWAQVEPQLVVDCLKQGKPLPDRFNRDNL